MNEEIREIPNEEALEDLNTLILFCRQNPVFSHFEGSLLAFEEELSNKGVSNIETKTS